MKLNNIVLFVPIILLLISVYSEINAQSFENELVYVKGGSFLIGNKKGDNDEKSVKKIYVKDFYIGKYEVTNIEYRDFLNILKPNASELRKYIKLNGKFKNLKCRIFVKDSIYYVEKGFENFPVNFVSWFGAYAYCKNTGGRLPTEAEWEYVAKGGKMSFLRKISHSYLYAGSNKLNKIAWYRKNSGNKPHKIGQKKPNKINVFDLSGNVAEWCSDWYQANYYKKSPEKNPQGPENGRLKVHRGGSWYNTPEILRITNRRASKPITQNATIGFRFVKDLSK